MKTKLLIIIGIITMAVGLFSSYGADAPPVPGIKPETQSMINGVAVSPYYTVGFESFNGKAKGGFGVDVGLGLSKTIQAVSFLETSEADNDAAIDRFGFGVQMSGRLGRWLKPYGRFSVGYSVDGSSGLVANEIFLRPEFGATIDVYHYKRTSVSVLGAWALDVDTEGHAAQRLKAGFSINF